MDQQYWNGMPCDYMDMYEADRRLMDMYPEIYRRIHPKVQHVCQRVDVPNNPRMYPYVDPMAIEEMVDEVFEMEFEEIYGQQFGPQFRRRGFFRDLITIILIGELLDRRRRRRRRRF